MVAWVDDSSDEPPFAGFSACSADVKPIEDPAFFAGSCVGDNVVVGIICGLYGFFGFSELVDIFGVSVVKSLCLEPDLHPFSVFGHFELFYGEAGERAM